MTEEPSETSTVTNVVNNVNWFGFKLILELDLSDMVYKIICLTYLTKPKSCDSYLIEINLNSPIVIGTIADK